jgi:hypothetical protein
MGLPYDPIAVKLFVDIYGMEYGRDIEPSEKYGRYLFCYNLSLKSSNIYAFSFIYDIMVSCMQLYQSDFILFL